MEEIIFPKLFLWGANSPPSSYPFSNPSQKIDLSELKKKILNEIDLLKSLNINSYRFTLEWNDLLTDPLNYIEIYSFLTDLLFENNIEPIFSLLDLDFYPIKFEENDNLALIFEKLKILLNKVSDKIQFYSVLNNPMKYIKKVYLSSYNSDFSSIASLFQSVVEFYEKTYNLIKSYNPYAKISVSEELYFNINELFAFKEARIKSSDFYFSLFNFLSNRECCLFKQKENKNYNIDFIGINFNEFTFKSSNEYSNLLTGYKPESKKELKKENFTNLEDTIDKCSKDYDIPLLITENSIGEEINTFKSSSLIKNLCNISERISKKDSKIFGYTYNSLKDYNINSHVIKNGLYGMDLKTNNYIPRSFGKIYSNIAKTNSIAENYLKFIN